MITIYEDLGYLSLNNASKPDPSPSRLSADDERGPKDNEIAISQSAVLLLSMGGKEDSL